MSPSTNGLQVLQDAGPVEPGTEKQELRVRQVTCGQTQPLRTTGGPMDLGGGGERGGAGGGGGGKGNTHHGRAGQRSSLPPIII